MISTVVRKALQKMARAFQTGNKIITYPYNIAGFTYVGVLMLIAISGIALGGVGIVWHQDMQREREKELLFIGDEFRRAIGSYYENTPGSVKQFPKKLEDLLLDSRFPVLKRHLRKIYADPIDQGKSWGLEIQQGNITGVYSLSKLHPIMKVGFPELYTSFASTEYYKDWKFIYIPGTMAPSSALALPVNPN